MVLVWHYVTCQSKNIAADSLLAYLHVPTTAFWSGVDLFYVLSGFLIGGIILDNHKKGNFLKVFWLHRCCRILPVLLLLLSSCWMLQTLLDKGYNWLFNNLMPWWSYLSFTQNVLMALRDTYGGNFLGITWSLAIEEQFYLFAPILILMFGRSLWIRGLLPLIVIAFVLRLVFPGSPTYVNMIFRMDALLAGVLVAVITRNPAAWSLLERFRSVFAVVFVGLLMITGELIISSGFGHFRFLWFSWFALLYSSFLLVTLLYKGSLITSPLRSPLLCFWGSIAYGLYMYHQCILGLLHGWLLDGSSPSLESTAAATVTAISFVVLTVCAWISFNTFEAFFLRIGKQQKYGSNKGKEQVTPFFL
jgi:peptidoglycan/LPS O-acetylase OafA/YrhL